MINLTKREKQVLIELLKDCKISDQEIARRLKTSRPTIYKIRKRLEDEKIIKNYFPVVDFQKLGLSLQAIILYRWKDYSKTAELENTIKLINSLPEVVLFIKGEGLGSKTDLIVSIHKDLKEYETFIRKLKYEWKDHVEGVEVFLSSVDAISKGYDLSSAAIAALSDKVIYSK